MNIDTYKSIVTLLVIRKWFYFIKKKTFIESVTKLLKIFVLICVSNTNYQKNFSLLNKISIFEKIYNL